MTYVCFCFLLRVLQNLRIDIKKMENIKNFVNGITGNNGQPKNDGLNTQAIPRVDGNTIKHLGLTAEKPRNRTESESSSTSVSSATSAKDKDPYFWVMWVATICKHSNPIFDWANPPPPHQILQNYKQNTSPEIGVTVIHTNELLCGCQTKQRTGFRKTTNEWMHSELT